MAKVTILKEGFAKLNPDGFMEANCTCCLVQSPKNTVIVDTLTPWDGPYILQKLLELNISPEEITYCISTHGHSDHTGNNNLFLNAKQHIVGYCVSHKETYYAHPFEHDEPFIIDEYISIIPTPGHTSDDISVVVKTSSDDPHAVTVIVGDLFENENDIEDPSVWTANSFQPEVQVKNRLKVVSIASQIIPGHGKEFKVLPNHISAITELCKKYDKVA